MAVSPVDFSSTPNAWAQPHLCGPGPQRLRLISRRGPARQRDDLEGRRDPSALIRKSLLIDFRCSHQNVTAKRSARPVLQDICRPHRPQFVHQCERRFIGHGNPVHIGDRQGEACPLQQSAERANVREGADPGDCRHRKVLSRQPSAIGRARSAFRHQAMMP